MVETPIRALLKYQAEKKAEKKKESTQDRAGRRTATATVAIALFTAVTVIVGSLQWCALRSTDEAIRGQLAEMRTDQRPWVYNKEMPKVTKFAYLPDGNIHVEMTIDIVNVGKAPAQDVSGRILISAGTLAINDHLRNDICSRAEGGIYEVFLYAG
jgi:hypothetical protein